MKGDFDRLPGAVFCNLESLNLSFKIDFSRITMSFEEIKSF